MGRGDSCLEASSAGTAGWGTAIEGFVPWVLMRAPESAQTLLMRSTPRCSIVFGSTQFPACRNQELGSLGCETNGIRIRVEAPPVNPLAAILEHWRAGWTRSAE